MFTGAFFLPVTNTITSQNPDFSSWITLYTLDLVTRWRWTVSFTIQPLYPQETSPSHTLDKDQLGSEPGLDILEDTKISVPLMNQTPAIPSKDTPFNFSQLEDFSLLLLNFYGPH
jgi:hypothetical protein